MAIQQINVGVLANDGTGDDLREAFIKTNQNFDDLDLRVTSFTDITAENIGTGFGLFADKTGNTFQFRKLLPDPLASETLNIRASDDGQSIYLSSTQAQSRFTDGTRTIATPVEQPVFLVSENGASVTVSTDGPRITISSEIANETTPTLTASLDANNQEILNVSAINNYTAAELDRVFGFDFGSTSTTITSIIDYILKNTDVDFGTDSGDIDDPGVDVDFGVPGSDNFAEGA